jgi:mono/diheme cytochrome c family protein
LLSINFRGALAERDGDRELVKGLTHCAPHSKLRGLPYLASILLLVVASAAGQSPGPSKEGKAAGKSQGANPSKPTFNKDVAPILFAHCASCHRPGEIASALPLLSYDNARSEAESIKEKVVRREMPPWPADPAKSLKFRNDPRLSRQEIDTLVAWVNAGAPKGNDADLPSLPTILQGWLHPKGLAPDAVMQLPLFHLPATGEVPYVRYLSKVPFAADKWVVALQVLPSNRGLVHHMAITEVSLPSGVTPADLDERARIARQLGLPAGSSGMRPAVVDPANENEPDMLGVYTPGTTFEAYGDDSAKLVKGGENMYLNFNIHYQTTGQPETDQPKIAFWFRPDPPKRQIFRVPASGETILAEGKELLTDTPGQKAEGTGVFIPPIPPNAENYEVVGVTAYTEPVTIYQLQPHAHLRGKDFNYAVVYPDGREVNVLSVPRYDFHWQLAYELDQPLELPAGSKLVVTAHYDNSTKNEHLQHHHHAPGAAHNSGPDNLGTDHFGTDKEVYFRELNQSWDEMFTPFIQYSIHTRNSATAVAQDIQQPEAQAEAGALRIVEVVGCLEQGPSGTWMLSDAGEPVPSETQPTSMAAVSAAATRPLGNRQEQLIGLDAFHPSSRKGQKTVVKGVEIEDAAGTRLNVTSLQTAAQKCSSR